MSTEFTTEEVNELIAEKKLDLPITIKLGTPVQLTETHKIESVTVHREPEAGDIEDIPVENQKMGDFFKPIAKCTGETVITVKKMKVKDLRTLVGVVQYFLLDLAQEEI